MSRRPAPVLDLQDALFGDTPAPPAPAIPETATAPAAKPARTTGHPRAPRRDKAWNEATPCAPTCLACHRPEPGPDAPAWPLCTVTGSRHATLCEHTSDAYRADVCLITLHVPAVLMTLPETGRTVAAVTCPYCERLHAHDPKPGRHYRISRCRAGRKPYIVHVPERSTP
ncbi:hypothetical protein [Nonomuraea sp. SBT364]|uniref:hypothetical protein n=1 Tax=Nonomuraea sp. SBT364 TaxID=1580530 RepID=UPI00066C6805|nr:hypothetical protein [Nonomuraea sp. SBT364]